MGWAKEEIQRLEDERHRAQEQLPKNMDMALEEIANLREELRILQAQVDGQNSPGERYKNYVLGGIIGAIISMALASLL